MSNARVLETYTVTDAAELFDARGPDLVLVKDMSDPQPFLEARVKEVETRAPTDPAVLEELLYNKHSTQIRQLEHEAREWIRHRFPGLMAFDSGFMHDTDIVSESSAPHVDNVSASRTHEGAVAAFRGPLSLSLATREVADFRALRIVTYATRPNREGLYKVRPTALGAKELYRNAISGMVLKSVKGVRQEPGDGVLIAGVPRQTHHAVKVSKGRQAELFDMWLGNDPRYWG